MRKILLLLLVISGIPTGVSAQVYYQRDAGSLSVLAGSSVLPVTSIRPTLIVTDNDVPRLEENQYSEFQLAVDNALRYLDKSQIPTGILYDRVYPLARLDAFNDEATDKSSYWHYIQAYAELYDASYQPGSRPTVHQVKKRLGQQELADVVPIGVIRYRFNYISDLSKQNNQLTEGSDGYFRDVAGRTGSPYLTRQTLIVAALAPKVRAGNILFKLQSQFIFNNTGVAVSSVQVDPGEGKPVITTTPDGNGFTVYYDTPGERTIHYVVTYANGTQATTYSTLEVEGYASGPASAAIEYPVCYEEPITSSQFYQGPDEPAATAGVGQVLYYYASNKSCNGNKQPLTKPVIVLDGFDPDDRRAGNDLYTYNLAYGTGQGKNLGEDLRKLGYDAVILNFPEYNVPNAATPTKRDGGADYIQRNAMVLMELIEEVNRQLQQSGSTEKLVVVGPSMGGLIARYALAYMEQNNRPHNTRLYISFDSPHRGANIPIASQEFLDYYASKAKNEGAIYNRDVKLNSPAARQMLLHHYSARSTFPAGAPNYRDAFQQELDALNGTGFPYKQNSIRKVAIINGSNIGFVQRKPDGVSAIASCEKAFTFELRPSRTIRMIFFMLGYVTQQPWLVALSAPITIAGAHTYFTPNYGITCTVFDGKFMHKVGRVTYAGTRPHTIGLDQSPGGWFNAFGAIAEDGSNLPGLFDFSELFTTPSATLTQSRFYSVIPNHSFIPSLSALAYKYKTTTTFDWAENVNRDLVCADETPFDAVYAPSTNQGHVALTEENVRWFINEIKGTPVLPTLVSGPDAVCGQNSGAFTTTAYPGATYTWTASSNISPTAFTTTSNTFTPVANGSGTGWVKVRVTNTCSGNTYESSQFSVNVGISYSSSDYPVSGPTSASCDQEVYYSTNSLPAATNYQWFWPSGWNYVSGQGTRYLTLKTPSFSGSGQVSVRVATACDPGGSAATLDVSATCSGLMYAMYPNPADSYVEIAPDETKPDNQAAGQDFEVVVYDNFAQEKLRAKTPKEAKEKKLKLDVTSLSPGIYVVQIIHAEGVEQKQLEIMR